MYTLKQLFSKFFKNYFTYRTNIKRPQQTETVSNQIKITQVILVGTVIVSCAILLLLIVSYFFLHNSYVLERIFFGLIILIYLSIGIIVFNKKLYKLTAWLLISLYITVSFLILFNWGINTPIGILMFGVVVILTSAMLGSNFIIPMSIGIIGMLFFTQTLNLMHIIEPDRSSFKLDSTFGDVISYSSIFGVFALLSWLSKKQMENALNSALQAEAALEIEKKSLARKVVKATNSLRESQIIEMKQLYRFAELGQLTAVVLHELANHLSVLTLDIDELGIKHKNSQAIKQARESISYIDKMIFRVRRQLKQSSREKHFNVKNVVVDVINELKIKASRSSIKITQNNFKKNIYIHGDPTRLSHGLTILINNAMDAILEKDNSNHTLEIHIKDDNSKVYISVIDNGIGIPNELRSLLFKPNMSSKKHGLGIGLYITKEIIETHFKGKLHLSPRTDCTEFIIELNKES